MKVKGRSFSSKNFSYPNFSQSPFVFNISASLYKSLFTRMLLIAGGSSTTISIPLLPLFINLQFIGISEVSDLSSFKYSAIFLTNLSVCT